MDIKTWVKQAERFLRSNSPEILSGLAVSGVAGTAYLSYQAGATIGVGESVCGTSEDLKQRIKDRWRYLIPPATAGTVTVICIVMAARKGNKRTAAITAAYTISERAFDEYKEKVKEKLGERKEQGIRDELAADKVRDNPPGSGLVLLAGENPLCCELYSGRYFRSNMETLRKAENQVNALILRQDFAYVHDFYRLAGIPHSSSDYDFGWTSDKLMELEFTSVLADGVPCLAFEYNYYKPL